MQAGITSEETGDEHRHHWRRPYRRDAGVPAGASRSYRRGQQLAWTRDAPGLARGTRPHARALSAAEAAAFGEVIVEAIPFGRYRELPAKELEGKIFETAANYCRERDGAIDLGGLSQSAFIAKQVPGARVVKALNPICWQHLKDQGEKAKPLEEQRAIFLAGDDSAAKRVVAGLVEELGFASVDTSSLQSRIQEPGSPVYNKSLTALEARRLLQAGGLQENGLQKGWNRMQGRATAAAAQRRASNRTAGGNEIPRRGSYFSAVG